MGGKRTKKPYPLQPSLSQKDAWLREVGHFVHRHLEGLEVAPSYGPIGAAGLAVAERVSRPIPETPSEGGLKELLDVIEEATDASLNTPGPVSYTHLTLPTILLV